MTHNITTALLATIPPDTRFLLDTNVLYFIHAGYLVSSTSSNAVKCAQYSSFVGSLLASGFCLYTTAANIQELLHLIEKKEYELYCRNHSRTTYPGPNFYSRKDYRNNSAERARLAHKLTVVLAQIENAYIIFDVTLQEKEIGSFVGTFPTHRYDPIDYIVVEDNIAAGRFNFITDDKDFQSDARIQVWTV